MEKVTFYLLLCAASSAAFAGGEKQASPHAWSAKEVASEAAFRNATSACSSGPYAEQALGMSKTYVAHSTMAGEQARVEAAIEAQVVVPAKLADAERATQCAKWTKSAFAVSQPSTATANPVEAPAGGVNASGAARS